MCALPILPPAAATGPGPEPGNTTPHLASKPNPKAAAWGSVPVALSLLVMLARRHHRLQPQHYTS